MCFYDYSHPAVCGIRQNLRHCGLRTRVKMQLGMLQVNYLSWFCYPKSNKNWQDLRYPKANISDIDEILRSAFRDSDQSSHLQLDLGVIDGPRCHFPSKA